MSKRKMCGNRGPSVGPLCHLPTITPGQGGVEEGPLEAMQSAVNSQGSCFLSWCHFPVSVRRAVGQRPRPFFIPFVRNENQKHSSARGSFFPAFLFLLLFLNKNPVRVSHCLRFLTPATAQSSPAPRPVGSKPGSQLLLFSVVLFHLPGPTPPQFSDRVQDFVGLFSFLTAVVTQSLSLSKVCDFKQLLLISV